ncbi:MAG: DUF2807 domain-containing protein [Sphingobium sp.]
MTAQRPGKRAAQPGKRAAALLACAGLVIGPTLGAQPAHAAMRGYIVTNFDSIRVEAPVRIILSTGSGVSGTGEGEREALDRVKLSVSGGALTVSMADRPGNGFATGKAAEVPTLYLSTGQLRRVQLIGGGVLEIKDISGLETNLSLNGSGEILVRQADIEQLSLYVGGGGRLTIAGKARTVRASVNGPGALEAGDLDARNAVVANDGPGSIHLTVHGPAKVTSSGSGDTRIDGKPVCSIDQRGVGQVICGQ